MDENQMYENRMKKALDQNPLDEKVMRENWTHAASYRIDLHKT